MQNFNPFPAATILAWNPGPTQWILENYIPVGSLFLFAGFMKAGKSTLIYPLAIRVAQGRPFLGFNTRKGGVLAYRGNFTNLSYPAWWSQLLTLYI